MGWIANAATRKETSNVGSRLAIRDGSGWLAICCVGLLLAVMASATVGAEPSERAGGLFASDNLVAWCIVPFDARKRSPAERAEMVRRLGLRRAPLLPSEAESHRVDSGIGEVGMPSSGK